MKKFIIGLVAVFAAVTLIGGVASAALTAEQVDTIVQMIKAFGADQATIANVEASLKGETPTVTTPATSTTPAIAAVSFTGNMGPGSTGENVRALQVWLNAQGFTVSETGAGSPGNESTYYGDKTKAAVAKWQAAKGVACAPYCGWFGPVSYAAAATATPSTPGTEAEEGDAKIPALTGGEGEISIKDSQSSEYVVDLGKSESVLIFEVEAEDSDISISRMDFNFDARPWLYFDEVNLLREGKEIASLGGSADFSEIRSSKIGSKDVWRARFVGLNEVIKKGDKVEFALEVKVLASMAGTRNTDTVNIAFEENAIRFVDGAGLMKYSDKEFDVDVDFEDTFGDGDLKLTISSDSPSKEVYVLDKKTATKDQLVAKFTAKATEGRVEIREVVLNATSTEGALGDSVSKATLYIDGKSVATASADKTGTGAFKFTRINQNIADGKTATFEVKFDFNKWTNANAGTITIDEIEVTFEDKDFAGDTKSKSIGETHVLTISGLIPQPISTDPKSETDGTVGVYNFVVSLTAAGGDFRINKNGLAEVLIISGTDEATTTDKAVGVIEVSDVSVSSIKGAVTEKNGVYRINEGSTAEATLIFKIIKVDERKEYAVALSTLTYEDEDGNSETILNLEEDYDYITDGLVISVPKA